jgi:hypothetical protein
MLSSLLRCLLGASPSRLSGIQSLAQRVRAASFGSNGLLRPLCSRSLCLSPPLGLPELYRRAVSLDLYCIRPLPQGVDLSRMRRLNRSQCGLESGMSRMIRLTNESIRLMILLMIGGLRRIIPLMIRLTPQLWSVDRDQGEDTSSVILLSSPAMTPHQGSS